MQFLHKDKLKSEIFNKNKSLLTKMFSSVNLNSEFSYFYKMGWRLRVKEIVYYRGSLKNVTHVESQKSDILGELSKNGVLGQFADLRGRLTKKFSGVFERG